MNLSQHSSIKSSKLVKAVDTSVGCHYLLKELNTAAMIYLNVGPSRTSRQASPSPTILFLASPTRLLLMFQRQRERERDKKDTTG